jgi:hypothetical protein
MNNTFYDSKGQIKFDVGEVFRTLFAIGKGDYFNDCPDEPDEEVDWLVKLGYVENWEGKLYLTNEGRKAFAEIDCEG